MFVAGHLPAGDTSYKWLSPSIGVCSMASLALLSSLSPTLGQARLPVLPPTPFRTGDLCPGPLSVLSLPTRDLAGKPVQSPSPALVPAPTPLLLSMSFRLGLDSTPGKRNDLAGPPILRVEGEEEVAAPRGPRPSSMPPRLSACLRFGEDSTIGNREGLLPPAAPLDSMLRRLRQESTLGNLEARPGAVEMLARSLRKKEVVDMALDDRMETTLCRLSMCRCHLFISSPRTCVGEVLVSVVCFIGVEFTSGYTRL